MKKLIYVIPILLALNLSSCSSNLNGEARFKHNNEAIQENQEVQESPQIQEMNAADNETNEESNEESKSKISAEKAAIEKIVIDQQSKLLYDEEIAIEYKGKKMTVRGKSKFTDIEDFNEFYEDIHIQKKIEEFTFNNIVVNENKGEWYFEDKKILTQGELNRISKREISKDNINNIKVEYSNIKGTISINVFKDEENVDHLITNAYKSIIKKEDKNAVYYIFEDADNIFKGIFYEEKKDDGYKAYIDLAYYNQTNWNVSEALELRGGLRSFFEKLGL